MTEVWALSEGHGKHTPGKRSPAGEREWFFNNLMGQGFREEATLYDVKIVLVSDPTGERDVPLAERTSLANQLRCNIYVSLHHNAFRGVWGTHTGTETYTHTVNSNSQDERIAREANNAVVSVYKLHDRGLKKANFHEVREPKMPSCLVEGGYMDSSIDIVVMRRDETVKEAGREIFRRLAKARGIKRKATASKPELSVTVMYRVQVGAFKQIAGPAKLAHEIEQKLKIDTIIIEDGGWLKVQAGAFTKRSNAEARLKLVQDAGYKDAFITTRGGQAVPIAEPQNEPTPAPRPTPPKPPAPKAPIYTILKVDGSWGPATTRRLQQVLGTQVTGTIGGQVRNSITANIHSVQFGTGGSMVVREMQRRMGFTGRDVDGLFGPKTLTALQRRMGTPPTGAISPRGSAVVTAMQRRLNENRF